MTRAMLLAVALLAGLGGCSLIASAPTGEGQTGEGPTGEAPIVGEAQGPPDDALTMEVVSITDGDTLTLRTDEPTALVGTTDPVPVRLIGIDAPEAYPLLECFGEEATAALAALAPVGTALRVAVDVEARDRYDRLLLYLWTPAGEFLNVRLVADGVATAILVEPNGAHIDELRAAEDEARAAGVGMWGACAGR